MIGKKLYENILYKTVIAAKRFRIRFDKIDGFIRVYGGTTYLVLLASEKYDFIYYSIRYLTGVKSGITFVISHNYAKIKVNSLQLFALNFAYLFMLQYLLSQFRIKIKIITTTI